MRDVQKGGIWASRRFKRRFGKRDGGGAFYMGCYPNACYDFISNLTI